MYILSMRDDDLDPGANTQMFQAFVDRREPEETGRPWMPVILAAAGLVIVVLVAWFLLV